MSALRFFKKSVNIIMIFALLENLGDKLVFWEKVIIAIVSLLGILAIFIKFLRRVYKNIKEANESITDFLELIPKLKVMTEEFGPTNSLKNLLHRVENKLYYTDQQIKIIGSCVGVATFETDKNGLYTFVSKKWMETTKTSLDEAMGNGWLNAVDDDDREFIYKEWTSCVLQNREFHVTARLSKVPNQEVSIVAWPIRNLDGSIEKFFGILI